MQGSFTSGIILKLYHETERNFKNVQSNAVRGGRDTSGVAIAEDGIAALQIDCMSALRACADGPIR